MFDDRIDAGRRLAECLGRFADDDPVVLGIPRGGVPVAYEVAAALDAPLDVILVRKLGVPFQPELAMGAIGEDDALVINDEVVRSTHVTGREFDAVERRERAELERRVRRFRQVQARVDLGGRTALIVDDGIATGSTARAACHVARAHGAAKVVLAVPVAPAHAPRDFADADEFVAYTTPEPFFGVGQFYADFSPTSDEDVETLLAAARRREERPTSPRVVGDDPPLRSEEVQIAAGPVMLAGYFHVPENPTGLVVFAHGSGSSRHSSRNRHVAAFLNGAGVATLLFDLLTTQEERDRANVFDVELLAQRLTHVTQWARAQQEVEGLPVGYFGASTGAAAALTAAAEPGARIAAVVSRGGRPDLAGPRLGSVRAPTRLIVGGDDTVVLDLNREALELLRCESDLCVVPGATHLFEEPGTLRQAAELARDWFARHFATSFIDGRRAPR
jgi:putative phosphoribosyl transferase